MAKKVIMTAPFEALTGNLSGAQVLEYAENNNPAFDAPNGVQYARNYKTRYIGARRSASGLTYFQVRTKSATKISNRSKFVMALLGGTGACRAAIMKNQSIMTTLDPLYVKAKAAGVTNAKSVSNWIYDVVYEGLNLKRSTFTFMVPGEGTMYIRNPWVFTASSGAEAITISKTVLVKFWPELATNPLTFTVNGMKGVAHAGDTFDTLITKPYNVLSISKSQTEVEGHYPMKLGDLFICFTSGNVVYSAVNDRVINHQFEAGTSVGEVTPTDFTLSDSHGVIWSD